MGKDLRSGANPSLSAEKGVTDICNAFFKCDKKCDKNQRETHLPLQENAGGFRWTYKKTGVIATHIIDSGDMMHSFLRVPMLF